jgi:hypothetical protein
MDSVLEKLQITSDQLNAMYTACPVDCHTAETVNAEIRERFGIDEEDDWVDALESRGVLTAEEAAYLRDE